MPSTPFAFRFLLVLLLLGACAPGSPDSPGEDPPMELEAMMEGNPVLGAWSVRTLEVFYSEDHGRPVRDWVDFRIEGDPAGAWLSRSRVYTDSDGRARTELHAGRAARFDVVAMADDADDAIFEVTVLSERFGEVAYRVWNDSGEPVSWVQTALFERTTCQEVAWETPEPRGTRELPLSAHGSFDNVEIGVPLAIYAFGIDSHGRLQADACKDLILRKAFTAVDINLSDMGTRVDGTYLVRYHLDATLGNDRDVAYVADAVHGMGADPAGFVVDEAKRHYRTPGWLVDELKSPSTRDRVSDILRHAFDGIHTSSYLRELRDFAYDTGDALSDLSLQAQLTFREDGGEFGNTALHAVYGVAVPYGVETLEGNLPFRSASTYVTVLGREMRMAEHHVDVPLGAVMDTVLHDLLLPRADVRDDDLFEVARTLYDCSEVDWWLGPDRGYYDDLALTTCWVGREALLDDLAYSFEELWDRRDLSLFADGFLSDTDGDGDMDRVYGGRAGLRFSDDRTSSHFYADVEGNRANDTYTKGHPVHDAVFGR